MPACARHWRSARRRLFAQRSATAPIRYDTICSRPPRQRCNIRSSARYDLYRTGTRCVRIEKDRAMATFRPKYITFDCYGTLTNFDMAGAARRVYGSHLSPTTMAGLIKDFSAYRLDEVLGAWKPYLDVVHNSLERACKRNGVAF